ncbi:hypothetical protein [Caenibacillus caldisaponilyticus]|uniref:hypothetical protein n=1 Tax=Caenibacillus caldisaponilyticus TaxID=1674942 RepID=UPI0009888321|nr:hypothetical protein [Caenibacillus caldisaponilyticus]
MDIESRLIALENAVEAIHQRLTELEKKAAAATTAKKIKPMHLNADKILISGTYSNSLHQP